MVEGTSSPLLVRLGLHRPELRAWAMYDWANSAFVTTMIAAVFPAYFSHVAAADLPPAVATARFATATTVALLIVAVLGPVLGAVADYAGIRKKLLAGFLALGVVATACTYFVQRGEWVLASVLFVLGNVGVSGSFVFYDSLLPHIARQDELDRVSTAGYACGYFGGGVLLAVNMAWILWPERFGIADSEGASRLSFLSVAVWWLVFSLPLFWRVPEPRPPRDLDGRVRESLVRAAFSQLSGTLRELRVYKQALLMLVAFLIYNDGVQTIIRMAEIYGAEIGLTEHTMIPSLLLTQFIGIPCAFLFGMLAGRIGAKRAVLLALAVYSATSVGAYFMRNAFHFFVLAVLIGMVQGGSQALSRSLFAGMIPRYKSSEFFAFFAVLEKFWGILGSAAFVAMNRATGSSRGAVLLLIVFFVVGGALLARVDVAEGRRVAREAEAGALM